MRHITNLFYRLLASRLSPSGASAKLSILIYHRVLPQTDPLFPAEATIASFDNQMSLLKSVFNVLPLHEAVIKLKAGKLPARSACITFDDGYADNVTHALPILQKHGLHATFFIATSYLNGGRMFNDTVIEAIRGTRHDSLDLNDLGLGEYKLGSQAEKTAAIGAILPKVKYLPLDDRDELVMKIAQHAEVTDLPNDLMMTTGQLKTLHESGMGIGGHTHRHPILAKLDENSALAEISAGKQWLEEALGTPIRLFAYPNGKPHVDYRPEQAELVSRTGFEAAVSTAHGVSSLRTDIHQLRRFTPWDTNPNKFIVRLLNNLRHS